MGKPNCAVVEWERQNGQSEVEAIIIKRLVLQGEPGVGAAVQMQYHGEIWNGQILSLHENMKDAKNALERELNSSVSELQSQSSQPSPVLANSRKRTKNKRLDGFETICDDDTDSSSKKQKPSGGKKKSGGTKNTDKENTNPKKNAKVQAAEKEQKRIERDRVNQEKEKERRALTERNNLLLQEMNTILSRRGSDDSFTSDVVSECVDLTASLTPPPEPTRQLEKTITELKSAKPRQELSIAQLQETLARMQRSSEGPVVPITPPSRYQPPSLPSTSTPQVQRTPLADTPRINTSVAKQVARPTVGGKCPRRSLSLQSTVNSDDEEDVCASCTRLKQRVRELEDQLKSMQGQVLDPPRPGRINPVLAEQFKMVELTPGSQVFIFQNSIMQAKAKSSYKAAASFLLNCFYTNDELAGMNLSGANEKPHPDKHILESIIGFVMKVHAESCPSAAAIKIGLRNKLSALESRMAKKQE